MPSLKANYHHWTKEKIWTEHGANWSTDWGGPKKQWENFLLPKIKRYLPAGHLLEIGYGYGRWVPFLLESCRQYTGVDIVPNCRQFTAKKFEGHSSASFLQTDGMTLKGIADASVDFVFSFDSLVHADKAVLESYVDEIGRVLKPGGAAFIHHSNLKPYSLFFRVVESKKLPLWIKTRLESKYKRQIYSHWRDHTVDARLVRRRVLKNRMKCEAQILYKWGGFLEIDCITTFSKP